jgi:hypothetical protein
MCILVSSCQRFRGTYSFHLLYSEDGDDVSSARLRDVTTHSIMIDFSDEVANVLLVQHLYTNFQLAIFFSCPSVDLEVKHAGKRSTYRSLTSENLK